MPKPRNILMREDKHDGYIYACPYCKRYVIRTIGLQQCTVCGGMVDNDTAEQVPKNAYIRFDGKESWK